MGWRIKRNDFPDIIRKMPKEIDQAVQDMADDLAIALADRVWVDTGVVQRGIDVYERRDMHARVGVGWYLASGFYTGFQELGTRRQAARPVVVPTAHEAEPIFAAYVEKAVKRACGA
jgi:hypothetical protein